MRVDNIPLEIKVILGKAHLMLSQLSVGDIIVLDQMVEEPLSIDIEKGYKAEGFACRAKNKKGVKFTKL